MPFRERLRKILHLPPSPRSSSPGSPSSSHPHRPRHNPSFSTISLPPYPPSSYPLDYLLPPSPSHTSFPCAPAPPSYPQRTRSQAALLYRPDEPLPKPKYPGRYNKPHQDMLRAFSFGAVGMTTSHDGRASTTRRWSAGGGDISPLASAHASRRESEAMPSSPYGGSGHHLPPDARRPAPSQGHVPFGSGALTPRSMTGTPAFHTPNIHTPRRLEIETPDDNGWGYYEIGDDDQLGIEDSEAAFLREDDDGDESTRRLIMAAHQAGVAHFTDRQLESMAARIAREAGRGSLAGVVIL